MTTEGTPQDVLREEAAWAIAATRITNEHGQLCPVWTQRMKRAEKPWQEAIAGCNCWIIKEARTTVRILEENGWRLDKAIAEAPDSPESGLSAADYWLTFLVAHAEHVHGCDHTGQLRDALELATAAPDTLAEKPGLDVERLSDAILVHVDEHNDEEEHLCSHACGKAIAAEYARLGSTDSEGR